MTLYTHYNSYRNPAKQHITLAEIVASSRAKEAAEQAERERLSSEKHAAFLKSFRMKIQLDGRFTEEERREIIAASAEW